MWGTGRNLVAPLIVYPLAYTFHLQPESESESESELLYDCRFTANQFVLATRPLRLTTGDFFPTEHLRSSLCNIFSDEGLDLWFTVVAGFRQCSHSHVWVPRVSEPHWSVSASRLPQPGGSRHYIYIPHEQGGPVIPPGLGLPFRCLVSLAGLRWRHSNAPPRRLSTSAGPCCIASVRTTKRTQFPKVLSLSDVAIRTERTENTVLLLHCYADELFTVPEPSNGSLFCYNLTILKLRNVRNGLVLLRIGFTGASD
jgi:hypothetical protein